MEDTNSFKRGNESDLTYRLKWAAWEWLYKLAGCRAIGLEVKLEGPFGRVIDVVGVGPENTIYAVEVKTSRADLFRDDNAPKDRAKLKAKAPIVGRRSELAEAILRQAEEYAKDVDPTNWESIPAYQEAAGDYLRVTKQEDNYRQRLDRFSIKFGDPRFLSLADYHYIMAPSGLIRRHEVPPKWGLLNETPEVVVEAPCKDIRKNTGIVSNIMRAISRANTVSMMRHAGVTFHEGDTIFPSQEGPAAD